MSIDIEASGGKGAGPGHQTFSAGWAGRRFGKSIQHTVLQDMRCKDLPGIFLIESIGFMTFWTELFVGSYQPCWLHARTEFVKFPSLETPNLAELYIVIA